MALYIVACDIADRERLRPAPRSMERHALRTQRSVFPFGRTAHELECLFNGVAGAV